MADVGANFETGTNTNNIATGDTGSPTAFDAVRKSAFGAAVYTNAQALHGGTLAASLGATGSGGGSADLVYSTALGTLTDVYVRFYLYLTGYDTSDVPLIWVGQNTTRGARVDFNIAGKLRGYDNPFAALFTTTTASVSLNQWVRIEAHFVLSATVGQGEVKLFNTAESSTVTETKTGTANKNTLANATHFRIGAGTNAEAAPTANYRVLIDQIAWSTTAYPGPFIANTVAPTVSGSTPVGSVLTAGNGTWNVTPTAHAYQWTSNGTNIGGATSCTYTTQVGDVGHAIGCTVTATGVLSTETAAQASTDTVTVTPVPTMLLVAVS